MTAAIIHSNTITDIRREVGPTQNSDPVKVHATLYPPVIPAIPLPPFEFLLFNTVSLIYRQHV